MQFKTFIALFVPFAVLFLVVGFADLLTGFRYSLIGHARVAWTASTLRLSNWSAVPRMFIKKYRWFTPLLVVIFLISVPLGVVFLLYDFFSILYLVITKDTWIEIRDARKAAYVHAKGSEIDIEVIDARTGQPADSEKFIEPNEKWYKDTKVVVTAAGWTLSVSDAFAELPKDLRSLIDVKHLAIHKDKSKHFVTKDGRFEFPVKGPYPTAAEVAPKALPVGDDLGALSDVE